MDANFGRVERIICRDMRPVASNIRIPVGLGPVTGVPLPLVSMGGTSILFTSVAFGIILSVSRDIDEPKKVIVGEIKEVAVA